MFFSFSCMHKQVVSAVIGLDLPKYRYIFFIGDSSKLPFIDVFYSISS